MNIRCYSLALFALGIGILVPEVTATIEDKSNCKIYVARNITVASGKQLWIGVEMPIIKNKIGDPMTWVFRFPYGKWIDVFNMFIRTGREVITYNTVDKLPVEGLLMIAKTYTELYSELLPHILAHTSLKNVVDSLSFDLLDTLTPEDRDKIGSATLAELRRNYANKESSEMNNDIDV